MAAGNDTIRNEIVKQIEPGNSVAPRDIAQALVDEGEDWRKLLPRVREQAVALYHEGALSFIRKRKVVSPEGLKGIYRLSKPLASE
ncbi:DUF3253 domain-containing protein [Kordiimonas sp.]|uniref:DUF3253 domain-containing protein n=1 Tax=Kordiimonas sp. TaxID=1970157 RepID=UPI003B51C6F9